MIARHRSPVSDSFGFVALDGVGLELSVESTIIESGAMKPFGRAGCEALVALLIIEAKIRCVSSKPILAEQLQQNMPPSKMLDTSDCVPTIAVRNATTGLLPEKRYILI
jgi:hypothetical protein